MKQFDLWDEVSCVDSACIAQNMDCNECTAIKRMGWKAALEMVLSKVASLNFKMFPTAEEGYASVVCDIEKELEE